MQEIPGLGCRVIGAVPVPNDIPCMAFDSVMSLQKFSEILLKNLCGVLQVFNDCEENGLQFRVRQRPEELAQVDDVDSFIFVLGAFTNFFFRP
jgi:hypothetical protein